MTTKLISPFDVNGIDYTDPANRKRFFSLAEEDELEPFESRESPPRCNPSASCNTNLFFGFFHDGTRNNYGESIRKKDHTHTNIARLYSCFPGKGVQGVIPGEPEWKHQPEQFKHFFRVYTPGVGSAFEFVGDSGKGKDGTLGAAAGYKGEPRAFLLQRRQRAHGLRRV